MLKGRKVYEKMRTVDRVYDESFKLLVMDTIAPIYKPQLIEGSMDLVDALAHYFNVDYREQYFIEVNQDFALHGVLIDQETGATGAIINPALGIKSGWLGLLGYDIRYPNEYRLEIDVDNESTLSVCLTSRQFHSIKKNLNVNYRCRQTGKDPTYARRLKRYHDEFVQRHFGLPLNWITKSGLSRPGYKKTGSNGSGD